MLKVRLGESRASGLRLSPPAVGLDFPLAGFALCPKPVCFRLSPFRESLSSEKSDRKSMMALPRRSPEFLDSELKGGRFLIVEARYYEDIAAMLLEGAKLAFVKAAASFDLVEVPGALEIPLAMAIALDHADATQRPFDGAVALGCVIRGQTHHFEIVANESARALMQLALDRKLAFGNGVLTVEDEAQALMRADPRQGDKGGGAARAALSIYRLKLGLKLGLKLETGAP
jgi:6,7-dimethyl-8-ribityllumazine synthase